MSDERDWCGFPLPFLVAAVALLAGYLALAVAVDPYDTGRSNLLARAGVRPQGPRTASASRDRDPTFAGAILGNSHIQLVDPARLTRETGIPFVQLSVPGTGPKEQLALAAWFLRHHPKPRALVIAVDDAWCRDDPTLANALPFPFWLLSPERAEYWRGLLRLPVAEEIVARLGWLARRDPARARPDGYWDYEPDYLRQGAPDAPRFAAARAAVPPDAAAPGTIGPFPAAERLRALLAGLPPGMAVVVVRPPILAAGLPRPGTPRAVAEEACRAALAEATRGRPGAVLLDRRIDGPDARDPSLFFDQSHYRQPLARRLEDAIAGGLAGTR